MFQTKSENSDEYYARRMKAWKEMEKISKSHSTSWEEYEPDVELKRCPFCGCKAEMYVRHESGWTESKSKRVELYNFDGIEYDASFYETVKTVVNGRTVSEKKVKRKQPIFRHYSNDEYMIQCSTIECFGRKCQSKVSKLNECDEFIKQWNTRY